MSAATANGAGGVPAAVSADKVLRDLLDAQAKLAQTIETGDNEEAITKKMLKKAGLPDITCAWTSANQQMLQQPLCWFFLLHREGGQAVTAIGATLHMYGQRHLVQQVHNLLLSITTACAFVQAGKLTTYEAFQIVEPVLLSIAENLQYLKAKRVADQYHLTARDAGSLLDKARTGTRSFDEKLEDAARKLRGRGNKRGRDNKRRQMSDSD